MLSNVEIVKQLGKNIAIYPFNEKNIKGASVNLTASEMAWSITTKKSVVSIKNNKKVITIGKNDTALIETIETVGVSRKIAGTYHSRVYNVSIGLGHIATTLNPGWVGPSLIAVHNHTTVDVDINVGDSFVTLIFEKLSIPSTIKEDNQPARTDIIQRLGIELSEEEKTYIHETSIHKDFQALCKAMKQNENYKKLKERKKINTEGILVVIAVIVICATYFLWRQNPQSESYENIKLFSIAYVPLVTFYIFTKH